MDSGSSALDVGRQCDEACVAEQFCSAISIFDLNLSTREGSNTGLATGEGVSAGFEPLRGILVPREVRVLVEAGLPRVRAGIVRRDERAALEPRGVALRLLFDGVGLGVRLPYPTLKERENKTMRTMHGVRAFLRVVRWNARLPA